MKRVFRLIITFFTLLCIVAFICSCDASRYEHNETESVTQMSEELLNSKDIETIVSQMLTEKYNEEFKIIDIGEPTVLSNKYRILAVPEISSTDNDRFFAYYSPVDESLTDGYFGVIMASRLTKDTDPYVAKHFSDYKVFIKFNADIFNNALTKTSTYEDAISVGQNMEIVYYLFVNGSEKDPEELVYRLGELGIQGYVYFYSIKDAEIFNTITDDSFAGVISDIIAEEIPVVQKGHYRIVND